MLKSTVRILMVVAAVGLFIRFDVVGAVRAVVAPDYAAYRLSVELEQFSNQIGDEIVMQLGDDPMFQREYDMLVDELWRSQELIDEGRFILDSQQAGPLLKRVEQAQQRFREAAKVNFWVLERLRAVMRSRIRFGQPAGTISA